MEQWILHYAIILDFSNNMFIINFWSYTINLSTNWSQYYCVYIILRLIDVLRTWKELEKNFNRTLLSMIPILRSLDIACCDRYIQHLLFAYRTTWYDSTHELPFNFVYGHVARIPTENALSTIQTHYQVYIDDYKPDFVTGWILDDCTLQK